MLGSADSTHPSGSIPPINLAKVMCPDYGIVEGATFVGDDGNDVSCELMQAFMNTEESFVASWPDGTCTDMQGVFSGLNCCNPPPFCVIRARLLSRGVVSLACFGTLWRARFLLYRSRILQPNMYFAAFSRSTRFTHLCTAPN